MLEVRLELPVRAWIYFYKSVSILIVLEVRLELNAERRHWNSDGSFNPYCAGSQAGTGVPPFSPKIYATFQSLLCWKSGWKGPTKAGGKGELRVSILIVLEVRLELR